jgi:phosphoribosyl-AMP cyclohydrolase / phosphoribosyl-ATP pyrophosphohydrolase
MKTINLSQVDWQKMDGLIPIVAQDWSTGQVLMVGWSDKEALELTSQTGILHFYSRSRKRIWKKGEQSGNILTVERLELDCDCDTILAQVLPKGPACHTGNISCFNASGPIPLAFLIELQAIIRARRLNSDANSYIASLLSQGLDRVVQKVGEEAIETVIASKNCDREAIINESADLLFHLMIMLETQELTLSDVAKALQARHDARTYPG